MRGSSELRVSLMWYGDVEPEQVVYFSGRWAGYNENGHRKFVVNGSPPELVFVLSHRGRLNYKEGTNQQWYELHWRALKRKKGIWSLKQDEVPYYIEDAREVWRREANIAAFALMLVLRKRTIGMDRFLIAELGKMVKNTNADPVWEM